MIKRKSKPKEKNVLLLKRFLNKLEGSNKRDKK